MESQNLISALRELRIEIERGEDIYEAPPLIHAAALDFGGQLLLCGAASNVEALLAAVPAGTEPSLVFELLRISMEYANDGGAGLRELAGSWAGSNNSYKAYIAAHINDFTWA